MACARELLVLLVLMELLFLSLVGLVIAFQ